MRPDVPATAEGDLQRTPLPHLLVYIADRRLTGALFLREPDGVEHIVRFEWGVPVRVLPGDRYAMFGELLIEQGIVSREVIEGALAAKGLLGDVLILTGHADALTLERVAALQLERRIAHLFGLTEATSFSYFDGFDVLTPGAGPACRGDVLRLIIGGLREYPRSCMSLSRLMDRLGDARLRIHVDAALDRFGWDEHEHRVTGALLNDSLTLVELLSNDIADTDTIRRVVYALLLTRQLDMGHHLPPLGVEETPPVVAVGRLRLTPAVHRSGAAAPDVPGDGERAHVVPRTIRRKPGSETGRISRPGADTGRIPRPGADTGRVSRPQIPTEPTDEEPVSDVVEIGGPRSSRPRGTGTGGAGS